MLKKLLLPVAVAGVLCVSFISSVKAIYGGGIAARQPYMVRVAARAGGVLVDESSLFSAMMPTYTLEQLLSVIDPDDADWVLTCRHCVDEKTETGQHIDSIDRLWVRAGDYSTIAYDGERHITVTEVVTMFNWDKYAFVHNDAVMLRLSQGQRREISGTESIIDFLPIADREPSIDGECHLYGWGNDRQVIREPLLKTVTGTMHIIADVVTMRTIGGYSMKGDSGGPLVCNGISYGVLSTGNVAYSSFAPIYKYHDKLAKAIFSRGEGFTITQKSISPYAYHIQGSVIADGLSINGLITRTGGLIQVDEVIASDMEIVGWLVIGKLNGMTYTIGVNLVQEIEYRALLPLVRK